MDIVEHIKGVFMEATEKARDKIVTEDFIEALQEISEAKGAFKRDPHEHAKSCIREMQATAIEVLTKHGIKPRGAPVDDR